MSQRVFQVTLAAGLLSILSIPALAGPNSKDSIEGTISIYSTVNVENKTLAPGQYRIVAQGNEVKFEQNGKVVADVPCTLKTLPSKAHETQVSSDQDRLTEIQISGRTQAVEFSSNGSSGS